MRRQATRTKAFAILGSSKAHVLETVMVARTSTLNQPRDRERPKIKDEAEDEAEAKRKAKANLATPRLIPEIPANQDIAQVARRSTLPEKTRKAVRGATHHGPGRTLQLDQRPLLPAKQNAESMTRESASTPRRLVSTITRTHAEIM